MSYKWWILVAIGLFGIGLVLGLVIPVGNANPQAIAALKELNDLSNLLFSLPPPLMVVFIFGKNALSLLLSFAFSPIFCLAPALALVANGGLLTFVSSMVIQEQSLGFVLAGLLPHGIIEIPAFILGEAAALSFGAMAVLAMFNREKRSELPSGLKHNLKYLLVAFALLLPAAIIETFITPLFLT
jgi:stage II sporulation protein M